MIKQQSQSAKKKNVELKSTVFKVPCFVVPWGFFPPWSTSQTDGSGPRRPPGTWPQCCRRLSADIMIRFSGISFLTLRSNVCQFPSQPPLSVTRLFAKRKSRRSCSVSFCSFIVFLFYKLHDTSDIRRFRFTWVKLWSTIVQYNYIYI